MKHIFIVNPAAGKSDRTDTDYPNLEFRYCSKCNGYYCYCIDHINNHVHITTPPEGAEKK